MRRSLERHMPSLRHHVPMDQYDDVQDAMERKTKSKNKLIRSPVGMTYPQSSPKKSMPALPQYPLQRDNNNARPLPPMVVLQST
jgi:hypothetical protein